MPNVFNVLYNRYIQQVKIQQVNEYNIKHREYLIRSGNQTSISQQPFKPKRQNQTNIQSKMSHSVKQNKIHNANNQNYKQIVDYNHHDKSSNSYGHKLGTKSDERPLKPNKNGINFESTPIDEEFISQNKFVKQSQHLRPLPKVSKNQSNMSIPKQERTIKPAQTQKVNGMAMEQFPEEQSQIVLHQCPEGCGRKFKMQALEKHVKICQKVFQEKRRQFKVDVVDDEAKKLSSKSIGDNPKPKSDKMPKWKKQSELLRRGLKSLQEGPNSTTSIPIQEEDDRTQCPGCGRKFNETAASNHIPNCIRRNKQKK